LSHPGIHVASLNIQNILPKIDELRHCLSQTVTADVMSLCETFLHDEITDSSLLINNYNFERRDCLNKKVGGVLVYIRKSIPYIRRLYT